MHGRVHERGSEPAGIGGLPKPVAAERPNRCARRLSHEFRTPLNAILGHVELMLDGSTGPLSLQTRDCLADVQAAGQDLLRQSRMLLLLVQALQARAVEDEQTVPVRELFETAWRQAGNSRSSRELTFDSGLEAAALVGDPFWLQVLARCLVDLYLAQSGAGALQLSLGGAPLLLSITWSGFDHDVLPATATALIQRIAELHGGRMTRKDDRGYSLSWPPGRLLVQDHLDLAAD